MFLKGQFIQKCMNNEIKMSLFTYPYVIYKPIWWFFSWNTKEEFTVHYFNSKWIRIVLLNQVCSTDFLIWFRNRTEHFCVHRTEQNSAGAELGSFTSFSVCMFKLRFVFVRSGAGGREGELAVCETRLSACTRTRCTSTQLSFSESFVWRL